MATTVPRVLTEEDLDIRILAEGEWRVSDKRFSPRDAFSLLGFIEKKRDGYEVMQLGRGFEWFSFPTFDEAVAHFLSFDRSVDPSEYVLSWMPSLA